MTNLKLPDWVQVFADERLTAVLKYLLHPAHILELMGKSFRFRQRLREKGNEFITFGANDRVRNKRPEGFLTYPLPDRITVRVALRDCP